MSQVLQDAASAIRDEDIPWYELLALKYDQAKREGEAVTVGVVLAANVSVNASGGPLIAPLLESAKVLIEAARTTVNLRQDVLEVMEYCVAITKCIVEAGMQGPLPEPVLEVLDELRADMKAVEDIVRKSSTPTCRCWPIKSRGRDQRVFDKLRHRMTEKLRLITAVLAVAAARLAPENENIRILGEAPKLPSTYVRRAADDSVVMDLIDTKRPASSWCHCVWGMGGTGKSLLASSVSRDKRTLSSFPHGVLWISVGDGATEEKRLMLLKRLATLVERTTTGRSLQSSHDFYRSDDAIHHLQRVRGESRCLVVLDDVWREEIIDSFAATGFPLLITARRRAVVSRMWPGTFTEVGHMTDDEALELLRQASQAAGLLPGHEAKLVAEACERLPLALGMVGRLGREDPLNPKSWTGVLDELNEKTTTFQGEEVSDDGGVLFPMFKITFDKLPHRQKEQFSLMVAMAPGVPITTEIMASLWDMAGEDVGEDAKVLVENNLLSVTNDAYMLHEITHEYLLLHTKMTPGVVPLATSRQTSYLCKVSTIHLYINKGDDNTDNKDLYSLVKMWKTVRHLDPSKRMWTHLTEIQAPATDKEYLEAAGKLMLHLEEYAGAEAMLKTFLPAGEVDDSGSTIARLNDLARSLEGQDKYEEAERIYRRAMSITEESLGTNHQYYSVSLNGLAGQLVNQAKYDQAEPVYRQAMSITERNLGTDHPNYSSTLGDLAALFRKQGKDDEAESLYRLAMSIAERTLGTDHPSYADRVANLAGLLSDQGKYVEAEPLYRKSMCITEKTLGTEHPHYSVTLNNLAELFELQGKFDKAEPLYRRGLSATEACLGTDHPEYSTNLSNLAGVLKQQGKYHEAETLYRRSMSIMETALGTRNPNYSICLSNLARVLQEQDAYEEAESLFRQALSIMEDTLGKDHPDYLIMLDGLGDVLSKEGKLDEAEPLLQQAVSITDKVLGKNHPDCTVRLNNLAHLLEKQGKYNEAEPLYRRAMSITAKTAGADHRSYCVFLANLARLHKQQDKYDEAEPLYRRALSITERTLGKEHPDYSARLGDLAQLLQQQGKYNEAEGLYRCIMSITEKKFGTDHPDYSAGLNDLAGLLKQKGELGEAERTYRRAMSITERTLGTGHAEYTTSLNNLARLQKQQGKYNEAEPLFRRALSITETALGTDHPDCSIYLNNLAQLLEDQGKYDEAESLYRQAMSITETALGPDYQDYSIPLTNLAGLLEKQGKFDKAEPLYRQVMSIKEMNLGADHPDYAISLCNLAELLEKQGKSQDAQQLYRQALGIASNRLGWDHPFPNNISNKLRRRSIKA